VAKTASTMLALGTQAPHFSLPDPATDKAVSLGDFDAAPALLVMVLSNHCPFVKHIADELGAFGREYEARGLAMVAINANDVDRYPDDHPDRMVEEVALRGYPFPYLFDESQEVAKAFQAACTPDFFLFDSDRRLVYRGQFDSSRPSLSIAVTGSDLRAACDAALAGDAPNEPQIPSIGCNIKWKSGNAPGWFA